MQNRFHGNLDTCKVVHYERCYHHQTHNTCACGTKQLQLPYLPSKPPELAVLLLTELPIKTMALLHLSIHSGISNSNNSLLCTLFGIPSQCKFGHFQLKNKHIVLIFKSNHLELHG